MSDNVFQFNWRGMTREPSYPYAQPQDGSAQARAAYIAQQAANMQGYNPLPNMQGYTPDMQIGTDSTPGIIHGRQLNQQGGFRSPTGLGMVNTGTGMEYTNREARKEELMEQLKANEDRINKLAQEYQQLQQEQETATEYLERNVAANRAGIGDTSQYNAWRARVEAREASRQAREADSDATLRQAKAKVDRAFSDIGWARGERQTELAKAAYKDAVDEYNEVARKLGKPEISESELVNKDTVTMFDTKDFIRQHRNSKGLWDSEENRQKAYEMAKSLGDEGVPLLDEIYGQITTGKANENKAKYNAKVQAEVNKIDPRYVADGDTEYIEVDGKPIPAKITVLTDGSYVAVVNGWNYKLRK